MATALVLVNRVRRMLRIGDTAAFDDDQSKVILDRVNDAVATVHSLWEWECDVASGWLTCFPATNTASVSVGSDQFFITGQSLRNLANTADAPGTRAVLAVTVPTDAFEDRTAVRIAYGLYNSVSDISRLAPSDIDGNLILLPFTPATATIRTLAAEYCLPTYVRRVLSMKNQQEGSYLDDVTDRNWDNPYTRRPHLVEDDQTIAFARRYARPTHDYGSQTTDTIVATNMTGPSRSVVLFPTPVTAIRIDYEYMTQHRELTATTDVYRCDPRAVEDLVVALAYARCTQDSVGDADPTSGLAMEQRVLERGELLSRQLGLRRDLTPGDRKEMVLRGIPTVGPGAG